MTAAPFLVAALIGLSATEAQTPPANIADKTAKVQARERLRHGQRLMASDAFAEAAKEFEAAAALDPLLFMAHYGLGTARMGLKEYGAAIAAFEGAREAFHHPLAVGNRIESDAARQARIRHLQDQIVASTVSGPSAGSPTGTGAAQEASGGTARLSELNELIRSHQESERLQELPPGLSLALGSAYFRTGRIADAEREYRAAIVAEPKLGEPRSNLAVVLLMTGRPEEARDQLDLAEKGGFKPPPGLKADVEAALSRMR